jgi:orotidine-5'-phosphate decarboxylase
MQFAYWLAEYGADGIICSAAEAKMLKDDPFTRHLTAVTPGIRMPTDNIDDQKRVMTPLAAREAGADILVIGRPISNPEGGKTSVEAVQAIVANMKQYQG